MARVTVEDCLAKISNRFELVIYAGEITRKIENGSIIPSDSDNITDKSTVMALRWIEQTDLQNLKLENILYQNACNEKKEDQIFISNSEKISEERSKEPEE